MSNLIITIIAIALVAVAALAGIWYGSAAFQEGQAKAKANKVMNIAGQVKAAHLLYRTSGGGEITSLQRLDLASNYLSTGGYLDANGLALELDLVTPAGNGRWNTHLILPSPNQIGERVSLSNLKVEVCQQIAFMATGSKEMGRYDSTTPDDTWNVYKDSKGLGMLDRLKKYGFDCYYRDDDGDSVYDEADGESTHFHMIMTTR